MKIIKVKESYYSHFTPCRVNFTPSHSGSYWKAADIQLCLGVRDERKIFLHRAAQHLLDLADLVQVVLPREHGLVVDHLPKDAAHTPDVQGLAVPLK